MSVIQNILGDATYVIIETSKFRDILNSQRNDVQKKICSTSDAMYILGCSKDSFYELVNDAKSQLRKSKFKGKWVLASVYEEAERISEKK